MCGATLRPPDSLIACALHKAPAACWDGMGAQPPWALSPQQLFCFTQFGLPAQTVRITLLPCTAAPVVQLLQRQGSNACAWRARVMIGDQGRG